MFLRATSRKGTRWDQVLFVLLYDLTSTYFEANPPFGDDDKRRFGYSRDKRPDCMQGVIGMVVTPEGRLTRLEKGLVHSEN